MPAISKTIEIVTMSTHTTHVWVHIILCDCPQE